MAHGECSTVKTGSDQLPNYSATILAGGIDFSRSYNIKNLSGSVIFPFFPPYEIVFRKFVFITYLQNSRFKIELLQNWMIFFRIRVRIEDIISKRILLGTIFAFRASSKLLTISITYLR